MVSPRSVSQTIKQKTCCSHRGLHAPNVATRFRNLNHGSSPLTILLAPARVVMGWACASILIRTQWYRTGNCLWQKAQSTAGTGGISIISKCLDQFQNTMVSTLRHHSRNFRTSTRKSFFAEVVPKRFSFVTSTIAETNIPEATPSKGSSPIWSAVIVKPIPRWSGKIFLSFLVRKTVLNVTAHV